MSYEYKTTTYYGQSLPELLVGPIGFRLRDAKYVATNHSVSHSITYGGMNSTPYPQSSSENVNGHWVVIWERYVPDKEEE
jgi:hypothetical protein